MFSEPKRRVTSYYESSNVTTILPLMTQPFDYKQKQSILPQWEELLLFNEDFKTLFQTDKDKNLVIFFEIIDFLPFCLANKKSHKFGQKGKGHLPSNNFHQNLSKNVVRWLVQSCLGFSQVCGQ